MKQHITIEQLNELSSGAKELLRAWWIPREGDFFSSDGKEYLVCDKSSLDGGMDVSKDDGDLPLLSIGQMIELLDKSGVDIMFNSVEDICDSLWNGCKKILGDTDKTEEAEGVLSVSGVSGVSVVLQLPR